MRMMAGIIAAAVVCCSLQAADGNADKRKAIIAAAEKGDLAAVKKLAAADPELLKTDPETGWTALHAAAANNQVGIAKYLIAQGIDINARGKATKQNFRLAAADVTPLHVAVINLHVPMMDFLCKSKADINARAEMDRTPLVYAVVTQNRAVLRSVILAGADLEIGNPLYYAAFSGNADITTTLLKRGAKPDGKNADGETAIFAAAYKGHGAIVDLLAEYKADLNAKNNAGQTALDKAIAAKNIDVAKKLVAAGAVATDQNKKDMNKPEPISISEIKWESNRLGNRFLTGTIKNNKQEKIRYLSVSFNLYDKDKNQVGNAHANVVNLEPGNAWAFRAVVMESRAAFAKIADITMR